MSLGSWTKIHVIRELYRNKKAAVEVQTMRVLLAALLVATGWRGTCVRVAAAADRWAPGVACSACARPPCPGSMRFVATADVVRARGSSAPAA